MQALSEKLQARLDTFNNKFGKKAEEDENRIWLVTNLNKPEHERVPHTINGSVIAHLVFSGDYEIEFVGFHKPKDNSAVLKDRREKAVAEAKAAIEAVRTDAEVLADPSEKKVKQKE